MRTGANKNQLGNNKYFDPKMGLAGGLFLASIVFFINYDHGVTGAVFAASKQGLYTFLAGGTMMRIAENLSIRFSNPHISVFIAVSVTTLIAITFTFIIHSARGTPKPLYSTIPTMIFAPMGFLWWAKRKRNQLKSSAD